MSLIAVAGADEYGDVRFVLTQLRHGGDGDLPQGEWEEIAAFLEQSTSLWTDKARRVIAAEDPALFASPFVLVAGRESLRWSEGELQALRRYLGGGGFMLIDDSAAEKRGPFARSVADLPARLFPEGAWRVIPRDDALYRSFFLLRAPAGRRLAEGELYGLWVQDRWAAVYSPNDLLGVWSRDPLGQYLKACEPGGEAQRQEAKKLFANIVMFSVTGTYKTDAIHQPFIEEKLKE